MKIAAAQQSLSSSHLEVEQREVSERLRAWTGKRPPRDDEARQAARTPATANDSAPTRISALARALAESRVAPPPPPPPPPAPQLAPETAEAAAISAAMEGVENDPGLALLRHMLERVFGIQIRTFTAADLEVEHSASQELQKIERNAATAGDLGWGIEYEYHEQRTEIETTRFAAEGKVVTEDGQVVAFKLELEMSRSYSERIDLSFRAGDAARQKDPLVVNFAGTAAQLADQRFEIDLDDDGKRETAHFAAPGSGFLVFDRNADGKVNSGKELFGPSSGDGFAELARLDHDQNGWIDENDPVYAQLRVWTKTADGGDVLRSLKDSGVGAISLARLATPFAIKDGNNALLGQVRSSSIYLGDDGKVGTVQQIDLAV